MSLSVLTMRDREEEEALGALHILWWLVLPLGLALTFVAIALFWPDFYLERIEGEDGPLEIAHFLLGLAAFIVSLRTLLLPGLRKRPWLTAWVAIATLGSFYIAGEEISWGQQLVYWQTPAEWSAINDQQETNLHNVSGWFDQKPRTLLEIGIIVGGILIPLAALFRPSIRRHKLAIVFPPLALLPTALLAEAVRLPERIDKLTGTKSQFFPRGSEVQEFYFYLFILLYMIVLRRHLLAEQR